MEILSINNLLLYEFIAALAHDIFKIVFTKKER